MSSFEGSSATGMSRLMRGLLAVIAAVVSVLFAWPILWVIVTSFRPTETALRYISPLQFRTFIPDAVTFDNYIGLFTGPFLQAIVNSFIIAIISVVFGLLIASAAAYVFATVEFRGRAFLFALVVFGFMIPFEALAVPLASTVRELGLLNTYTALILPGLANGLAIFLLRQFFLAIPISLSEAAWIDGASWARIYWKIYLPLSVPALISAGLMIFLFQWQAYLWPLLVTTESSMNVGSVALAHFFGQSYDADYGLIFAGAAVLSLVPAVLVLLFQRHFVETAAASGIKE